MMERITSLATTPSAKRAVDLYGHRPRLSLGQRLGGEHVLDLRGADADGQRPEGAVRRRVAVAADDGHTGLREALLRPDDVDDALTDVVHTEVGHTEISDVLVEDGDLLDRERVRPGLVAVRGRHVVVDGRDGELGAAHLTPGHAQRLECLRRGDFVHQVQVDVEKVRLARLAADDVSLPNLL